MTEEQKPIKRGRFVKGQSGNPAGRPPLISEGLKKQLASHSSELLDIAIAKAKDGDESILIFLLGRLLPSLKPVHSPLNLEMSDTTTPLALANSLMVEAVSGNSPDAALAALSGLGTLLNVQTASDLSDRIAALEQRLLTVNGH